MSQVHIHPDYDKNKKDNDIAILKLKICLSFNKNVQPACLPRSLAFTGANALISGWGRFRGRDCHKKKIHTFWVIATFKMVFQTNGIKYTKLDWFQAFK